MKGRVLAVLLVLLVVVSNPALTLPARSASTQPALDMGYGPSTLFPASWGTPVYSTGDQLWVRSHYNTTIQVRVGSIFPSFTSFLRVLGPGVPIRLISFNSSDPQGFWTIRGVNTASLLLLLFVVSDAEATPANMTLAGRSLSGGALRMNFTTSSTLAMYDAQACVLGGSDPANAFVQVPQLAGTGSLELVREGNAVFVTGQGQGNQNYSFSVDLYYSYSFLAPNSTTTLLSRSVRVATSDAVLVSSREPIPSLILRSDAALKTGRYQLRAFFEGAKGLALADTEVLIPDQKSWVWLGGCQNTPVYSNDFGISAPLGADPASWPRAVWLTYTTYGEQGLAEVPLRIQLAAVNFIGAPWGVKLSNYKVSVTSSSGVQEVDVENGTMFVALDSPEGYANFAAGLGGRTFFTGTTGPIRPFFSSAVYLNVAKLGVTYLVGGSPFEGGTVKVSDATGILASAATGTAGGAVFYLPAGRYNVTGSTGNSTTSQSVELGNGQDLEVVLGNGSGGAGVPLLMVALGGVAVVGAAANVLLLTRGRWRSGLRRRKPVGQVGRGGSAFRPSQ